MQTTGLFSSSSPQQANVGGGSSLIGTLGAALVLVFGVVLLTGLSLDRTQTAMVRFLAEKGVALVTALESGVRSGTRSRTGIRLQYLVEELADRPDVRFIAVTMPDGTILAHSNPARVGEVLNTRGGRELGAETIAALRPSETPSWAIIDMEGSRAFVVFKTFHPKIKGEGRQDEPTVGPLPYVFLGLDLAPLEVAQAQNRERAVLLGAGVLLAGMLALLGLHAVERVRSSRRGQRVAEGRMQIGDIMALIEYAMLILYYLIMGIMVFMIFPRAQSCANRVSEVLSVQPEAPGTPRSHRDSSEAASPARLELCNVTFQYQGAEEPVLNNISFSAHKGQTTAIIGGTGSGKSTVASLIPRFYDIQSGTIRIDGRNIRHMPKRELRDKIGYVPQKAFLFSGTILDNFLHGKKDAGMEEIRHAAQVAQISDFIDSLESGYQTCVSQGGSNFSGGQRQRLSIARALVKRPEIYIFDDSFSALDFKTDARLRAALREEVRDAAVILVAQRISTIMDADQIVVLDEGRVAGTGTHRELMESCQVYQQIAQSQLSEEELA